MQLQEWALVTRLCDLHNSALGEGVRLVAAQQQLRIVGVGLVG